MGFATRGFISAIIIVEEGRKQPKCTVRRDRAFNVGQSTEVLGSHYKLAESTQ